MINRLLTTFNRNNIENNADLGEKIGSIGLGLLRIGFGKTVTAEKLSDDSDKTIFTKKAYSTSARVVAIALFILALPITLLFTGIGCVGTAFSKSHKHISNLYIQFEVPNNKSPKPAKYIHFGGARGRFLNQTSPAAEVENLQSIEIRQPSKTEDDTTLQMRKIPPLGTFDTVMGSPSGFKSVHGSDELFSDSEIVEKLDIIKRIEIGSNIYASYTKNKKTIIQQQATRGCTAATAAMLIMDNRKEPDLLVLRTRNLGDDEYQMRDIQNAGLKAVINSANDLSELRNLIIQNDSCIVSVFGKLGGHVIVVDEVSKDLSKIRLRDPYHGWEITVNSEAFLKEWHGGKAIQIVKN
jgi:hypothetical protein